LAKVCIDFFRHFHNQTQTPPPEHLWDASGYSSRSVLFNGRIVSIRVVHNAAKKMFMFDFGPSSTTPWKLAVYTATAALYVCRLPSALTEEDIALDLVSSGIPFRTLQAKSTLSPAPVEPIPPVLVPMRLSDHTFNEEDYKFYLKQCQSLMLLQRSRAALLRGGYVRRIALDYIGTSQAIQGPWGVHSNPMYMFVVQDSDGVQYVDDELTPAEYDILCGIYVTFTGMYLLFSRPFPSFSHFLSFFPLSAGYGAQISHRSWYPLLATFEGSGDDIGRWTDYHAEIYRKRHAAILDQSLPYTRRSPITATLWKNQVRGSAVLRRVTPTLENLSRRVLEEQGVRNI